MPSFLQNLTFLSLALAARSSPLNNPIFERAACQDNLGRCLVPAGTKAVDIASRSAAAAFCSSYLNIPVVTSVVSTTTPVSITIMTVTNTDVTATQTSVITTSVVSTQEAYTTVTSTSTTAPPGFSKRAVSSASVPACVTKGASYSAVKITSACSCVNVTPSTTLVTSTAPASTSTMFITQHATTTYTFKQVSTTVTVTTQSNTVTTTTTTTSVPCYGTQSDPYTVGGDTFEVCNGGFFYTYNNNANVISQQAGVTSVQACAQICSTVTGCIGVNYFISEQNCQLLTNFSRGASAYPNFNSAAIVTQAQ